MYKLIKTGVQRLSDMAFIPEAEGNTDWKQYKKWKAAGGVSGPEFTQVELDQQAAIEAEQAQKAQDIIDNLPSWAHVSTAVDNIANLADAKVFIKKLARITYWLAKNKKD